MVQVPSLILEKGYCNIIYSDDLTQERLLYAYFPADCLKGYVVAEHLTDVAVEFTGRLQMERCTS